MPSWQRAARLPCMARVIARRLRPRIRLVSNNRAARRTRPRAVGACLLKVARVTACSRNRLLIRPRRGALLRPKARRLAERLAPRGRGGAGPEWGGEKGGKAGVGEFVA